MDFQWFVIAMFVITKAKQLLHVHFVPIIQQWVGPPDSERSCGSAKHSRRCIMISLLS